MTKNTVIIVLIILCGSFFVFSMYQRKITKIARVEAEYNLVYAEEQQQMAVSAQEEARKQQERAAQALKEAERQRQSLEEALKKCK